MDWNTLVSGNDFTTFYMNLENGCLIRHDNYTFDLNNIMHTTTIICYSPEKIGDEQ